MSERAFHLATEDDTDRAGRAFAAALRPGDVVGLVGSLGAGKTHFVRAVVAELRSRPDAVITEPVTSPTYTLINRYEAPAPISTIVHADLYRLAGLDDLESTGYWDELQDADLTFVEWIDQIPEAWPGPGFEVRLAASGSGRSLAVAAHGALEPDRLAAALSALERAGLSGGD